MLLEACILVGCDYLTPLGYSSRGFWLQTPCNVIPKNIDFTLAYSLMSTYKSYKKLIKKEKIMLLRAGTYVHAKALIRTAHLNIVLSDSFVTKCGTTERSGVSCHHGGTISLNIWL